MTTILVIASREDWPTDRVVKTLTDRGAGVFRLDAEDFPQQVTLAGRIGDEHGWTGRLSSAYHELDLADVTACYYRTRSVSPRTCLGGIISVLDC